MLKKHIILAVTLLITLLMSFLQVNASGGVCSNVFDFDSSKNKESDKNKEPENPEASLSSVEDAHRELLTRLFEVQKQVDAEFSEQNLRPQTELKRDILDESLFVMPINDGEAAMAFKMLVESEAKHIHISKQGWGATLDGESLNASTLKQVKRVYVFEMPSLSMETKLKDMGLEVIIVDHHDYKEIKRHSTVSSIEQLANHIGYKLNKSQEAMSQNDQNYIVGMKQMGLTLGQIRAIRTYDLVSQGKDLDRIVSSEKRAKELITILQKINGVYILRGTYNNIIASIYQELGMNSPNGKFNAIVISATKLAFSGDKDFIQKLLNIDYEGLGYRVNEALENGRSTAIYTAGGGTLFGFKPHHAPKGSSYLISDKLLNTIEKLIRETNFETKNEQTKDEG